MSQGRLSAALGFISSNLVVLCLVGALVVLTYTGISNAGVVSMLGILICMACLLEGRAKVDLWVFIPLVLYVALSFALAFAHHGTILYAYASSQIIFVVIYLAASCLDKDQLLFVRHLAVGWVSILATIAILYFAVRAMGETVTRLAWPITSANANGILFVVAWFASLGFTRDTPDNKQSKKPGDAGFAKLCEGIRVLSSVTLVGLGLTMSLGSFLALLIGLVIYLVSLRHEKTGQELARYAGSLVVRVALTVGIGIQMYMVTAWADTPWFCIVYLVLIVGLLLVWRPLGDFLETHAKAVAALIIFAVLIAVAAVIVRPSALATFAERIHMMQNGLSYIAQSPLTGIGQYEWRYANLADGDTYYNTWHIHNVLIHVAVEMGIPAALLLLVIVVRFFVKRTGAPERGGFAAFVAHNLIDTSFFYTGITALTILTTAHPREGGVQLGAVATKLTFAVLTVASIAVFVLNMTAEAVA